MEEFMDILWTNILAILQHAGMIFNQLLSPLHIFGPMFVLALLAFSTVLITKYLNKVIITKRYLQLEKDFKYWYSIREEAMKCDDHDLAKGIAKNIDQAKLNRVYYDYFLEGFLLGLARNVMPVFLMVAYVNTFYRPEALLQLFGQDFIFKMPSTSGGQTPVGSIFFYILCLAFFYIAWMIIAKFKSKNKIINTVSQKTENTTVCNT